jgi:hypothetical protein
MTPRKFASAVARRLGLTVAPPVQSSLRARLSVMPLEDRAVPAVVTIEALSNVSEGGGAVAAFRLTRSDTTGTLSVGLSPLGTARAWTDYTYPFSVTFANGSATADVIITPINDTTSEPTETITMSLLPIVGHTVGTPASATVNLLDNDPQVLSVAKVADVAEGGITGQFRVTRIGDLSQPLTAGVTTGGTATVGDDYLALSTSATFPAGAATLDIFLTARRDNLVEGDEAVTFTVDGGSGYTVSGGPATLTIADDPPVISVTATDVLEGSTSNIVFTRTGGNRAAPLTVAYTVGGTATPTSDYSPLSGTVTFAANSDDASVAVSTELDEVAEGGETVTLALASSPYYVTGFVSTATVFLVDNNASLTLTASTANIPVNANKTNASDWRHVSGTELVGIPLIRDFDVAPMRNLSSWNGLGEPPTGTAIADPELKSMTATVADGLATGEIKIEVVYPDAFTGGRIRLWADQTKTTEIVLSSSEGKYARGIGSLPNYPTSTFYVEGTRPSLAVEDITLRVSHTQGARTVTKEQKLTVTPVVAEFSVNPHVPSGTTFMTNVNDAITGLNAGEQSDGGMFPSSGHAGVTFTADLNPAGEAGRGAFVQNVTGLINGSSGGILFDDETIKNVGLRNDLSFPISDPGGANSPLYNSPIFTNIVGPNATRHNFSDADTPYFASDEWAGRLSGMDITFQARMYLVWKYNDDTLYTLARADWQVAFQATLVPTIGLAIPTTSVVSASPKVVTNADPAKVVGPAYNEQGVLVLSDA